MPTAVELYRKYVNRKGYITVMNYIKWDRKAKQYMGRKPGIRIPVRCLDMRFCYGRTEILIRPVLGRGSLWIQLDKENPENSLTLVGDWDDEDKKKIERMSDEEHEPAHVDSLGP